MTGLLIKDWKLFKNQGRYLIAVLFIAAAMLVTASEEFSTFSTSYITFLIAYFALSTINYDEYDNGMAFLMTLPVSRRIYVSEKYLLTVLLTGGAWLFSVGINMVFGIVFFHARVSDEAFREMLCTQPSVLLVVLAFLSISLPLFLKFGTEKGRMVSFGILGAAFLALFISAKMGIGVQKLKALDQVSLDRPLTVCGICILLSALVVFASYVVSLKFMEKKEF